MHFAYPWAFLLFLALIPLLVRNFRSRRKPAITVASGENLKALSHSRFALGKHSLFIIRLLVLSLLIVVIARPERGQGKVKHTSEGLDIVLAVDTSGSMEAMDFTLGGKRFDRLTVVKNVMADFIAKRTEDRIGMVVFGSEAFTQAPLTLDHEVLLTFLDHVKIGMAGRETAIGDAIAVAVKRLKDIEAKSRVVILLTDGSNTAGTIDPKAAADAAKTLGIKVYTIAVGTDGKVPFPVNSLFGPSLRYQKVEIDHELLKAIATVTGGRAFQATDTEALKKIYDTIDQLEKTKVEVNEYVQYEEVYGWFLWPAFGLLGLELLLGLTRLRRLPA